MKLSIKTLIFIILCFSINNIYAQRIKGVLIAGFNMCQVDGDEEYGYHKFGFNFGPAAILPFGKNNKWDFTLETIYNQKGSYQKPKYEGPKTGEYKLILNYAEVPVLVHYTDKDIITVGTGFSWGRLVNAREWEHGIKTKTNLNGPYKKDDINCLVDLRFKLYKRMKFNIRYAYSIRKIRTREFSPDDREPWTRKQYNNLVTFRILYIFNEKAGIAKKYQK